MPLAGVGLSTSEAALLLALIVRRLGQVWRRAEPDTPESWLTYSDRIGPEHLSSQLRESAVGREALTAATASPSRKDMTSRQAVIILADALAAGFAWSPGTEPALDSAEAATAPLSAGVNLPADSAANANAPVGDGEPLYWPLTSRAQVPHPQPESKLLKADSADPGNLYRGVWQRVKSALQTLPPDPAALAPALVQVLREVDNVPVPLGAVGAQSADVAGAAAGRFAGMTDVIMTAWPIAVSLTRALAGRMDESPSQWLTGSDDQAWWSLTAVSVSPVTEPRSVDELAGVRAAQGKALNAVRDALAKALSRDSLNAVLLGSPGAGQELLLLDAAAGAADTVRKTVAGLAASLAPLGVRAQVAATPLTVNDLATADLAARASDLLRAAATAVPTYDAFGLRPRAARPAALAPSAETRRMTSQPVLPPPTPAALAETPAIARPTLAPASPQSADDEAGHEEAEADEPALLTATASSAAPPAAARIAGELHDASAIVAGPTPADLTRVLRRHAELAFSANQLARAAGVRLVAAPGEWWLSGPSSVLPDAVVRLVEFWSAGWGHRAPSRLLVALAASDAGHGDRTASAVRAASALAARAAATSWPGKGAGAVAWFPRHSADLRACFPLDDITPVARLGQHVLNLSGLRISADGLHQVERLGRGHEWVAGSCRRAASVALPTAAALAPGLARARARNERWRATLAYSLNRFLGRRRSWSRKKSAPTPVEILVDAIHRNRWLGADRPTRLDATLYLDLAGRWVEALRPTHD
ncbi:MAG: hypothetical protein AB7K09_09215 [Planctomycetota bacterium]